VLQLIISQKAVMQALNSTDCSVEPHVLPVLMKVKKILAKRPSQACVEPHVSHVSASMVSGYKTMTMMKDIH